MFPLGDQADPEDSEPHPATLSQGVGQGPEAVRRDIESRDLAQWSTLSLLD